MSVKELLKNGKFVASAVLLVGYWAFMIYSSYESGPILAEKMIAYNKSNPFSWFDFLGGAFMMFLMMVVAIIGHGLYTTRENRQNDPGDKGGNGDWKIPLPILKKVISISDFKKIPTDGRIHMGTAST